MQHTKTPWRVGSPSQMGSVVADEPVPEINGSDAVQYYGGHLIAESIAPRNAAFIVRACNAHEQLVAALEKIVENAQGAIDGGDALAWFEELHDIVRDADRALAAAGAA